MPWCPVCKNEYTKGVEVCSDCGAALVDSLNERKEVLLFSGEEVLIQRMKKFMEYNDIPVIYEWEDGKASLYVLPKHERKAKQAAQVFLTESAAEAWRAMSHEKNAEDANYESDAAEINDEAAGMNDDVDKKTGEAWESSVTFREDADRVWDEADCPVEDAGDMRDEDTVQTSSDDVFINEKNENLSSQGGLQSSLKASGGTYRKKSERADDLKSSGEVLLVFGILGCIALLLIDFGILPIRFGNRIMMNGIMFALFLFFIGFGVYSLKGARKFRAEASDEDALTERIDQWVKENLTAESIDAAAELDESDADEICFFKRTEAIRQRIADEFEGVDEAYLDSLAETIYQEMFE